jgi:hypothetical protein
MATTAQAESCNDLSDERESVKSDMVELVANYPGTHAVLVGCAAQAQNSGGSSDQEAGSFLACAGIGCLAVGFGNCIGVAGRWYDLRQRMHRVEHYEDQKGCP